MKLRIKVILTFAVIMLMISIVTFYIQVQLNSVQNDLDLIVHRIYPEVIAAHNVKIEINYQARPIRNAIIYTTQEEYSIQGDRLKKSRNKMKNSLDTIKKYLQTNEAKEKFAKLESALIDFDAANQKAFDLAISGQKEAATLFLNSDIRSASEVLLKSIDEMIKDNGSLIKSTMESGDRTISNTIYYGMILFGIILLSSLILSYLLFKAIDKPISLALKAAKAVAKGNLDIDLESNRKDEFGELFKAFIDMKNNINNMISDLKGLTDTVIGGDLDKRVNAEKFEGAYNVVVGSVNATIEQLVLAIRTVSYFVDKISKGDIPDRITEVYPGEYEVIKGNVNILIDNLNLFVADMAALEKSHTLGDIDAKVDVSKFQGVYAEMAGGLNTAVHIHVNNLLKILNILEQYSQGNLKPTLEKLPGKQVVANNILNLIQSNLNNVISELNSLINSVASGDLSRRGDKNKFNGAYADIISGFNLMIDSADKPILEVQNILERISEFDFTHKIHTDYSGVWNKLKMNTNKVIDDLINIQNITGQIAEGNLSGISTLKSLSIKKENKLIPSLVAMMESVNIMIDDVKILSDSAINGNLNQRIEANNHKGEYKHLVMGINETINALLAPINEAQDVLKQLSTGNLTVYMQGTYNGDHQLLKLSINSLVSSLNNLLLKTQEVTETLVSNASHIYKSTERMSMTAQQQSNQVTEVAAAIEELTKTITENAHGAAHTASAANKNGEIAVHGGEVVQDTIGKMTIIAKTVNDSAAKISDLGDSSLKISEIISVIDDIADQTNLLALNAAIEAARAGEQGRGFAVVADEVRKLAERTTTATKEIASMIKGIQNDTQVAVEVMKEGNSQVHDGITYADQAGLSLKDIVSSSKEVLDMIKQIAAATEEQSATSEEIAKVVDSISYGIKNTTDNIKEIERFSEELNNLTIHLKDLMEKFNIDPSLIDLDENSTSVKKLGVNRGKYLSH